MGTSSPDSPPDTDAQAQRRGLLDAQRAAHQDEPRSFKDDALTDKIVSVEPDGTGPTSTGSFDPAQDQQGGSGNAVSADETAASDIPASAPAEKGLRGVKGAKRVQGTKGAPSASS